jgi:4-hydroxy-tetrahydrodipicolinate synthase
MKKPVFEGVATALVTPFKNGTVDYEVQEKLLDFQIANGVKTIVICGTTGESAAMTDEEQIGAVSHAIQYTAGRCQIIAGTGSNNTAHCIAMSRVASSLGASALLVVTPYYNKCTQQGLVAHYTAVADASSVPVIVYNVPSRTGVDASVETYRTLSRHPNINGVKEASPLAAKTAQTISACGDEFFVWSGNDNLAVPMMSLGAKGLISVLSNVRPKQTVEMMNACFEGNFRYAGKIQIKLTPLIEALFCEVNPIPVKKAMELIGLDAGLPRLPLTPLTGEHTQILKSLLSAS